MEFISNLISQLFQNFNFVYIIVINIVTYLAIKGVDIFNKEKMITTWQKRIVLLCSIFIVTLIYIIFGYNDKLVLFNSAIVTPVSWSWIFKPILKKIGIDYNKIDKTLNYE